MALLADQSAEVNSNLVGGAGSQSKRFTMPGNVAIKVESVVATVSNGAGSAVTPELTIRDQSGVVIATTKQDASIPAGDTGTATYALRLNGNFGTAAGFIRYNFLNVGGFLNIRTTNNLNPDNGGVTFEVEKSEFGIYVTDAATGAFHVEAPFVFYDVGGGTYRVTNSSLFDVDADAVVFGPSDSFTAQTVHASVNIDAGETVRVHLHTGKPLLVEDHLGNPIFKVDENGDLHGKTGKALVFDL